MINRDRLADTFKSLVKIDSISKSEADFSDELRNILESMGAETIVDNAGEKVGGNTGNLLAKFKGNVQNPPLLLNAHMDTVAPGKGIIPILKDGVFTSDGKTILGADDKSAIAILLEAMTVIQENHLPHGPLELLFTICEEIGLLGAKHLDYSMITATRGYALDSSDTNGIVTRAPECNHLEFKVYGRDAHAGAAPEKGINAISLACKAIANIEMGRIDHETTCNIGMIEGGIATNIVPNMVTVKGEARSHDQKKLDRITNKIVSSFKDVIQNYHAAVSPTSADEPDSDNRLPRVDIHVEKDFPHMHIPDDHPVVTLAQEAAANLGRKMVTKMSGGGADANIFFEKGIITGVLGTGMRDMHTVRESVPLDDMVRTTELVIEIIKQGKKGKG